MYTYIPYDTESEAKYLRVCYYNDDRHKISKSSMELGEVDICVYVILPPAILY